MRSSNLVDCAFGVGTEKGAVSTEYAIVLGALALGCAAAFVSLGLPLLRFFYWQRAWLSLSLP